MNINKTYIKNLSSDDSFRLFCFPYAGGGASVFSNWQDRLEEIQIYPVQYPGKENRIMEKPISDIKVLVNEIYDELKKSIEECPFIMFGHSLGTKVVYELSLKIYKEKNIWPKCIIVSGGGAPNCTESNPISHLEDWDFIQEIKRRYSSIPDEIAENREVMKIFLPALRADFIMSEEYRDENTIKLGCPILGLMGIDDDEMNLEDLLKWKEFTGDKFTYKYIKGEHMFVNTNVEDVISSINEFIKSMNS